MTQNAVVLQHPANMSVADRLTASGIEIVQRAKTLTVDSQYTYEAASELLRDIKRRAKDTTDFWAEPKAKAHDAHREIVAKEKSMLTPLNDAERIIKANMAAYQRMIDAQRRAQEEEIRRRQQEERDALLKRAIAAEAEGDDMDAQASLAMAEMVEDMTPVPVAASTPSAVGISTRKTWKAKVIDDSAVPVLANGVLIRPIDLSALNTLARITKGTATIPGIEFYEDSSIAVR